MALKRRREERWLIGEEERRWGLGEKMRHGLGMDEAWRWERDDARQIF
jgi:hypothetical protein